MDTVLTAAEVVLLAAIGFGYVTLAMPRYRTRQNAKKPSVNPDSMAARLARRDAARIALKSEQEQYRDRLDAAFNEARECGKLIVSMVIYADLENDKHSARNSKKAKTLLTRITPVMTHELAEKVRAYEVAYGYDFTCDGLGEILFGARNILWRVEEVPAKYEPPNLKDSDRIHYPEMSVFCYIPQELTTAARKLLGYDYKYVQEQIAILESDESAVEVEPE
jgi:hypothetical protein